MIILPKKSQFLKESFTSTYIDGDLKVDAANEQSLLQAKAFWQVVEKAGHIGDYLGSIEAKYPFRGIVWRGDSSPLSLPKMMLSCGFNALNVRDFNYQESQVDRFPDLDKTTAERILADIKGDGLTLYHLPKTIDPEWFFYFSEDLPSHVMIGFDSDWEEFWQILRSEPHPTKTPIVPIYQDLKKNTLIERGNRYHFPGAVLLLDHWPEDSGPLWAFGYSLWWGRSWDLLMDTWRKKSQ